MGTLLRTSVLGVLVALVFLGVALLTAWAYHLAPAALAVVLAVGTGWALWVTWAEDAAEGIA
jgi:hypothetical protein